MHKAWATVKADGQEEARETLPPFLRESASVYRVETYSMEDVAPVWDEAA